MLTRRAAGLSILAGLAASRAGAQGKAAAVPMGVCLYNFRQLPRPADQDAYLASLIEACVQCAAPLVEVNSNYIEPRNDLPFTGIPRIQDAVQRPAAGQAPPRWMTMTPAELAAERDRIRQWRLQTPASHYAEIARRFRARGLTPFSYVSTFTWDMPDAEMEAVFRHAQGLGVKVISTNQTKVELGPRLVPFAERYGIDLGFHNHAATKNPNEVASIESFEKLFALSPRFKANLDTGHMVAANLDPLAFLTRFPDRITHLHLKDRKRDEGANLPWGQGDTPLREILQQLKRTQPSLPVFVEYEYRGERNPVEETRACLDFMRAALA